MVQKPSNLVGYYTLGGYLVGGYFYLPRKILCVAYDRAGHSVMIGVDLLLQHNQPITL
mgnify:CR=1 FL=1